MSYEKTITRKSDFPTSPHWAILAFRTVHHEGDERSRTNPGHGYPAYDETVCEYTAFTDFDAWKRRVEEMSGRVFGGGDFVAFKVAGVAKVVTKLVVDVESPKDEQG